MIRVLLRREKRAANAVAMRRSVEAVLAGHASASGRVWALPVIEVWRQHWQRRAELNRLAGITA